MINLRIILAGALAAASLTACAASSEVEVASQGATAEPTPYDGPQGTIHGSRVKLYESTDELAAESELVLVGNVTGDEKGHLGSLPMRHVKVSTDRVVRGSAPGEITVVEYGAIIAGGPPPLNIGEQYLLYLVDTAVDEHPAHHYYVTGSAGQFAVTGDRVRRMDPETTGIPETSKLESLLEVAATKKAQKITY